jgi:hypothetical protein
MGMGDGLPSRHPIIHTCREAVRYALFGQSLAYASHEKPEVPILGLVDIEYRCPVSSRNDEDVSFSNWKPARNRERILTGEIDLAFV